MKNTLFRGLSVIMLVGLLLSACGGGAPATEKPVIEQPAVEATEPTAVATEAPVISGGILTLGIPIEPETLDPGDAVYVQEQFILMNLFDSLLSMATDGSLHPALATAWEPNADYTEFTFTLREDVTFHDGTPLKAGAVKASFDHIISDAVLESGGKSLLQDHQYVETVEVDDYTVTIKFADSYPTFLRDAARQWLSISSPAALEKYGQDYGRNPVGTGPFKLVQWDAQSQIVLERNPDYAWAAEIGRWNPNLYFDLSGSTLIKLQENYQAFKSIFWWSSVVSPHTPKSGTSAFEKVVFGSDIFGGEIEEFDREIERYVKMLDTCGVGQGAQANIFGGTLRKILDGKK